ncbi:biopolymer transporter TolR [Tamlana sp. 2201CG12-4]|uniref:TolB family protein n=1 Tax=Tamlana sp. 2201CG12-4 TaxID=3112582 RepID=UPI002DB99BD2|nr:biopolymer transporter TolR [Tamlana sp. 2201CG12-4]MEC3908293.1 biopolymer transporter TolR [Tamlana sp. 2201CG12-4]
MTKFVFPFLFFCLSYGTRAQEDSIGIFQYHTDIGHPKNAGSGIYNSNTQTYTIKGSGYNIWGHRDEFHYLYNKLKGNFIVTANFEFSGLNEIHRKIGWMARASEADNAVMVGGFLHGDGLTAGQWRERKGADMQTPFDNISAPKRFYQVIQLERRGNKFIVRAAQSGEPFEEISSKELKFMPDEALVGIVICSHDENTIESAKVWNVRIDQPVDDTYNPKKQGWLGCRMETMNIFNGKRKIIYEKDSRFEAPNWMPNGKNLLFNMDGSLYTIPKEGGAIKKINTGSANNLNNDHCISFDGKMLGISHDDGKGSRIFVLPLEGGEPNPITEAPSYLHGWSPNNKELVYVAKRKGVAGYNIYKKSIKKGKEIKLTSSKKYEHVDGCEYAPDGKYIYYNGSKNGGTMQLWRMKPDGSNKEQLTFDEYNDWFPHISPDGKWIAFISFMPDIKLNSHPSFKQVMLRLMPVSGGAPRVLAYLYGGQGTINVNSWAPNSEYISFVSNSGKSK